MGRGVPCRVRDAKCVCVIYGSGYLSAFEPRRKRTGRYCSTSRDWGDPEEGAVLALTFGGEANRVRRISREEGKVENWEKPMAWQGGASSGTERNPPGVRRISMISSHYVTNGVGPKEKCLMPALRTLGKGASKLNFCGLDGRPRGTRDGRTKPWRAACRGEELGQT